MAYYIEKRRKKGPYYESRVYAILPAHLFMTFIDFINARKGMRNTPKTCFCCNHRFADAETIYIAPVLNDRNRIVCKRCADVILENQ